ncbi:neurogenic locus Notch protein-like [Dreissena polymorpha]|nr:neurogenic locus Notch protein-like [Dreissena polymorpha]
MCHVSLCPYNCLSCIGFQCNSTGSKCTSEGLCINGCVTDFIGPSCERTCPTHCAPVLNGSRCSSDGVCYNGCVLHYYGSWCENACPAQCLSVGTENRCVDNGTCREGCIAGYSGERCEHRADAFLREDSKSASTAGMVAGSFFGGVALTIACGVIALVVWMKRKKPTPANEYYNTQTFGAGNEASKPDQPKSDAESNYTSLGGNQEERHTYSSLDQ